MKLKAKSHLHCIWSLLLDLLDIIYFVHFNLNSLLVAFGSRRYVFPSVGFGLVTVRGRARWGAATTSGSWGSRNGMGVRNGQLKNAT